ncbi:MAG TPA: cytochrome c3 family protein [Anaerolineae bacterium]|nr:cytochrome c3 family protein [Anaerolineae bacterium]MCB0223813.1 cytochrome c3 family protein [Anaerolineae bacterium]MCB9104074.1 cytochrome c3 family protein [Anaerolineales bacterium]HRV93039.1 cytochrome c3 family protein [Anaerolineae bacterium]
MNQIFHPSANVIAKASIGVLIVLVGVLSVFLYFFVRSSWMTGVNISEPQPVPFSHLHHVRQVGLDCRYCHTSVEEAASANIPPTETCMTCHSQIWTDAPMLEPVRVSWRDNVSLEWERLHDLADFVYFNHSIHVNKGIGCETCHGRVDNMALPMKVNTLQMEWCLECHRNPAKYIRPTDEVFTMGYAETVPAGHDPLVEGHELVAQYGIEVGRLDNCSICHR